MEKKIEYKYGKLLKASLLLAVITIVVFSCQYGSDADFDFSAGEGTGGSMARFTIAGNYLYTVDDSKLNVFDISNAEEPDYKKSKEVGFGVETIFPLGDKLFLGTSTGMYIYDVATPENPSQISFFEHVYSCDPVVSDGDYAYVTLNSSSRQCWRWVNELQIIDLHNLSAPTLVKQYQMNSPRGLAIRDDSLWVCDKGLKVYNVSDKQDIQLLKHFTGLSAYDIILNGKLALVIGETGFVQYKTENGTIHKLSEIPVEL